MGSTLQAGDPAPDFTTTTDAGEPISLSDLRGKKVILYFYPKDDTPGCTIQACGFRDSHADFEAHDAAVFGISPDGETSHAEFRDKYDLPFTLLVDEDHAIAEAYGVWGEQKMYGRSHFVVDEEGKIIDARGEISAEESPALALEAIRR